MITHLLLGGLAGCIYQSASESLEGSYDAGDYTGPGSDVWVDEDVRCDSSSDCLTGEACIDSVCQVEKCTDNLDDSVPPLGKGLTFYKEKEIVVADTVSYQGGYWLDGYAPDRSMDYEYSWNLGSQRIQDIAAGDFYGLRPEFNAVVISGQRDVQILGNSTDEIDPGFAPSAIAAGDVDGDGLDELVAVGSSSFSVCDVDEDRCETWEFGAPTTSSRSPLRTSTGTASRSPSCSWSTTATYMYAFNWDLNSRDRSRTGAPTSAVRAPTPCASPARISTAT